MLSRKVFWPARGRAKNYPAASSRTKTLNLLPSCYPCLRTCVTYVPRRFTRRVPRDPALSRRERELKEVGDFLKRSERAVGDMPINCPCEGLRCWFFREILVRMGILNLLRGQSAKCFPWVCEFGFAVKACWNDRRGGAMTDDAKITSAFPTLTAFHSKAQGQPKRHLLRRHHTLGEETSRLFSNPNGVAPQVWNPAGVRLGRLGYQPSVRSAAPRRWAVE